MGLGNREFSFPYEVEGEPTPDMVGEEMLQEGSTITSLDEMQNDSLAIDTTCIEPTNPTADIVHDVINSEVTEEPLDLN